MSWFILHLHTAPTPAFKTPGFSSPPPNGSDPWGAWKAKPDPCPPSHGMHTGTLAVIPWVNTGKPEAGFDKPTLMGHLSPSHSQQGEKKPLLHCYSTCFLRNLSTAGESGSTQQHFSSKTWETGPVCRERGWEALRGLQGAFTRTHRGLGVPCMSVCTHRVIYVFTPPCSFRC